MEENHKALAVRSDGKGGKFYDYLVNDQKHSVHVNGNGNGNGELDHGGATHSSLGLSRSEIGRMIGMMQGKLKAAENGAGEPEGTLAYEKMLSSLRNAYAALSEHGKSYGKKGSAEGGNVVTIKEQREGIGDFMEHINRLFESIRKGELRLDRKKRAEYVTRLAGGLATAVTNIAQKMTGNQSIHFDPYLGGFITSDLEKNIPMEDFQKIVGSGVLDEFSKKLHILAVTFAEGLPESLRDDVEKSTAVIKSNTHDEETKSKPWYDEDYDEANKNMMKPIHSLLGKIHGKQREKLISQGVPYDDAHGVASKHTDEIRNRIGSRIKELLGADSHVHVGTHGEDDEGHTMLHLPEKHANHETLKNLDSVVGKMTPVLYRHLKEAGKEVKSEHEPVAVG